jgi:hypothetical protein
MKTMNIKHTAKSSALLKAVRYIKNSTTDVSGSGDCPLSPGLSEQYCRNMVLTLHHLYTNVPKVL